MLIPSFCSACWTEEGTLCVQLLDGAAVAAFCAAQGRAAALAVNAPANARHAADAVSCFKYFIMFTLLVFAEGVDVFGGGGVPLLIPSLPLLKKTAQW